jgi:formate dehydrogenase maturation protein FdhE
MFDAMLKLDSRSFTTIDSLFIRKGESFRHLDYGSHFAKYTGFNFDICVMQNDAFDDASICPQMHPTLTNRCVDS